MRSIVKNRKQRPTIYLPISIKLVVKIVLVVLGLNTLARKHEGKRKIFHKTDRLELASGVKNTEILSPL
jgi:hypothetical protein